jgi:ubiquinone/menaquinone biosynthesis C-methylase UbiE
MEEFIHLDGGEGAIPARTVDVSRNGMKVVVNRPHSFDEVHRITVNLPGAGGDGIPCRIRRSEKGSDKWEIGLEFDGDTDARMLLVERWLESMEKRKPESDSAPTESRQVPRTRCTITDIQCTDKELDVFSAEDISVDGMLIRAHGEASSGELLSLTMKLPDNNRPITFTGRVAYVVDSGPGKPFAAGVAIETMKQSDRNRLRGFIVDIASGAAMLEYHKLLKREEPSEEFRVVGKDVLALINTLASEGLIINLLDEEGLRILETRIEEVQGIIFFAVAPEKYAGTAFFSFTRDTSSFSFSARRVGWNNGIGEFENPESIYRGEKRAGTRRSAGGNIKLAFSSLENPITGRLMDSSRRGILCEIPGSAFSSGIPAAGESLDISIDGKSIPGEVRHIFEDQDNDGNPIYRIGLETGIRRREPETTIYNDETWKNAWDGPQRALKESRHVRPRTVSYTDHEGREIVALLHLLNPDEPCTAVVIPPAFGKKKEALAPLALTLMTHFAAAGENVAVLRYDGINRPGESANANSNARRGYEMIGYRIDQGYTDLEASMRWVLNNDVFRAEKTVLISFSMAALDARRLQATSGTPRADYWISVMGVSSSQGALRNILGGLDVIANHRMGIPIGTMGMLGQLIDMDRMAGDMTRLGYATAADAREAMSRIESPVTWLYGAHDKWMIPEEIRDIMSIASPGIREIIEIPTAHNLRTSDDAISSFQMISDAILRQTKNLKVPPVSPDKAELLDLLTRERERVMEKENLDPRSYWKGYLVGENEGEEGYDFYGKLADFQDFVRMEVSLLDPRPGESIADMGCGTGLISQAILSYIAEGNHDLSGTRFTAVDLVDEALSKAREKYLALCNTHANLESIRDSWIAMDLEPEALAGLRRITSLTSDSAAGIEDLRDRVKGLKSDIVDRLQDFPPELMSDILKGKRINADLRDSIDKGVSSGDALVLEDLNRGARFITGNLDEEDLKPLRRLGRGKLDADRLAQIRSSELILAVLDFGDWSRDGRIPLDDESFDAISGSLFLSYLFAPEEAIKEFARMLKPGGRLLISTMKPDSDISGIFTRYIQEQSSLDARSAKDEEREQNLREARSMLNEAAALFSLEEDGWFRFFDENELITMMRNAGLTNIRTFESLGTPAQATIVTGFKKSV